MEVLSRYVHGSGDSTDIDVFYWVDELPSTKFECNKWCKAKEGENANLISLDENHLVNKVFKGTPDEVNNSLLATYGLHKQECPLPEGIHVVERDKVLKYIRAIRVILSHLSRSQYREQIKMAISKLAWSEKINVLAIIDLSDIDFTDLNKNMTAEDIKKVIAFQIGQSLGLLDGREYYTKSDIADAYPVLRPFLYRDENSDVTVLQQKLRELITRFQNEVNPDITYEDITTLKIGDVVYDVRLEKRVTDGSDPEL